MFITAHILKKRWDINLINTEKIRNFFKARRVKLNLTNDEKYLEKISIPTFDGSGYTTHPYIIEFQKPFNGFRYYLAHTPYDNHNIELENPSLCVSDDGVNFIKPIGIKDPLLPIIKKGEKDRGKFYNDNFILYENGELQIWYRYTEEDKTSGETQAKNWIYRIVSKDGVNFGEPELMIENDGTWYLSPSIIKIDSLYYLYYFDKDLKAYVKISRDLKKWSKPKNINVNNFNGKFWHGEVRVFDNKLYMLFLTKDYKLYLCKTEPSNPFNFDNCKELKLNYYDEHNIYGHAHPYKSTFIIKDGYITLYIPFAVNTINYFKIHGIKHIRWTMTYTHLKISSFNKNISV